MKVEQSYTRLTCHNHASLMVVESVTIGREGEPVQLTMIKTKVNISINRLFIILFLYKTLNSNSYLHRPLLPNFYLT